MVLIFSTCLACRSRKPRGWWIHELVRVFPCWVLSHEVPRFFPGSKNVLPGFGQDSEGLSLCRGRWDSSVQLMAFFRRADNQLSPVLWGGGGRVKRSPGPSRELHAVAVLVRGRGEGQTEAVELAQRFAACGAAQAVAGQPAARLSPVLLPVQPSACAEGRGRTRAPRYGQVPGSCPRRPGVLGSAEAPLLANPHPARAPATRPHFGGRLVRTAVSEETSTAARRAPWPRVP